MGGIKYDQGKPRTDLLPVEALEEVSKVLGMGAEKYAEWNWYQGICYSRLIGAALRHLFAFMRGEDTDPESGLSHVAHCVVNLLFLLTFIIKGRESLDDRRDNSF